MGAASASTQPTATAATVGFGSSRPLQMDSSMGKEQARHEVAGMREWAEESCGIPASEIVGFRNP